MVWSSSPIGAALRGFDSRWLPAGWRDSRRGSAGGRDTPGGSVVARLGGLLEVYRRDRDAIYRYAREVLGCGGAAADELVLRSMRMLSHRPPPLGQTATAIRSMIASQARPERLGLDPARPAALGGDDSEGAR